MLLSYSPVDRPEKFNRGSVYAGVSGGRGAGAGFDISNISSRDGKIAKDLINYNLFIGLKAVATPYNAPGEVHIGWGYTTGNSISIGDIIDSVRAIPTTPTPTSPYPGPVGPPKF